MRGKMIAAVFSMQGVGNLLGCIVMYILLSVEACPKDAAWRIGLAFGAVPSICAFYFRAKSHETEDFKAVQAAKVSQWVNMKAALRVYWKPLLGTAGTWLILDM
jgi:MFS transporter, PHS family, inorganic phosphate transporter